MKATVKRGFDVVVSGGAIVLLAPLMLLISLLIRLDSSGPVLFAQKRVGRDLREFRIFKFRTMLDRDPESIDQFSEGVICSGQDPRITRVGRMLRAMSLDELPQLFNIMKGDMSLVGPRPILREQVEVVPEIYRKRFSVRPGLTGLAQVQGRRSLGWMEQLEFDANYVDRASFFLDLRLIMMTAYVVIAFKGIYGGSGKNWREYREELRTRHARDSE
ncbi:sugar transferase [Halomonas heilongjiangensis]|uniref:Sugar transferase n=1 Tax=Halomonas heilongjiangensis TaxID=1387883 RepID=A0A2N7TUJ2_9GAMM|nr:sugar transferase [Halomonas heilongjiangensis]PMR71860.1 sugar transferase [Halomonas heilongjiangensis]PXX87677.1 sugar transferase [Halomonas heilongjiangensis]